MISRVSKLALAAVAWVLSSCATQVYLNKWEPAQVDLPRETQLRVDTTALPTLDYELRRAFKQQIAADGFYSVYVYGPHAEIHLHDIHVNIVRPSKDDKYRKHPYPNRVDLTADVICNYQRIYRRALSAYVGTNTNGDPDWEGTAEDIAEDVMRDLTPHVRRYSMGVDSVDNNPAVEMAAQACASGNWEQGRSLALSALQQNPNEAEACYVLGIIERNARNYPDSDSWFAKAHNMNPQSKYASALRENLQLQQDEARAQSQLNSY